MNAINSRRVNLFLVGGMKCGSTTLHNYLAKHPQIFMSSEKEPGFFVPEIWGDRSPEEYDELFSSVTDEKYIGESSTYYTKQPTFSGVAKRIYEYNPKAKILYIVRDPIKRTISHYFHNRRDLFAHAERHTISKAIKNNENYTAYSNYAMQVKPFIKFFGMSRIYIVTLESLVLNPEETLKNIYEWLSIKQISQSGVIERYNSADRYHKSVSFLAYSIQSVTHIYGINYHHFSPKL